MTNWQDLKAELAQLRDEAKLQAHLGSKEAQDEWAGLEDKWHSFSSHAEIRKSEEGIKSAAHALGDELKAAYLRIRKAL